MKKFMLAALLALPLTAMGQQRASAGDCCTPVYRVGFSLGLCWRGWCGCDCVCGNQKNKCGGGGQACGNPCSCPWYGTWPQGNHFNVPAPTGYPYWPGMGGGYGYGGYAMAPQMPQMMDGGYPVPQMPMGPGGFAGMPGQVQAVGYNPAQAPAYWYGR